MVISIDHGNRQVKTVHKVFVSGLVESSVRPALGNIGSLIAATRARTNPFFFFLCLALLTKSWPLALIQPDRPPRWIS